MKGTAMFLLMLPVLAWSQTKVSRNISTQGAREVVITLDYADLKIETWDKNEISITGEVTINEGENDNAFQIESTNDGGSLRVVATLKDKENIPKRVTIHKDGKEFYFKAKSIDDPVVRKFLDENGHDYSFIAHGIQTDIHLTIFIPRNLSTSIDSKYGLVEFTKFEAPLHIDAKYGKIDATISNTIGELTVRTRHGEILSNLQVKFDEEPFEPRPAKDHWTTLTAKVGQGPVYWIESKYGTVYLRR